MYTRPYRTPPNPLRALLRKAFRETPMLANIRGLVERLELAGARGLMPLYEGISNAIDAIEETGRGTGVRAGTILVRLLEHGDLVRQAGDEGLAIDGVE